MTEAVMTLASTKHGTFAMLILVLVLSVTGCATLDARGQSVERPATTVMIAEMPRDGGGTQVVLLTLYSDNSGFLLLKQLGEPPLAGRLYEGTWEWRGNPRRLELTPVSESAVPALVFLPEGDNLVYVGELLGRRPITLSVDH